MYLLARRDGQKAKVRACEVTFVFWFLLLSFKASQPECFVLRFGLLLLLEPMYWFKVPAQALEPPYSAHFDGLAPLQNNATS